MRYLFVINCYITVLTLDVALLRRQKIKTKNYKFVMYFKYIKLSISNFNNYKFNKGLIGMGIYGNINNSYKLVPVIITGLNFS